MSPGHESAPPIRPLHQPRCPAIVLLTAIGLAIPLTAADTTATVWINMARTVPAPGLLAPADPAPIAIAVDQGPAHGSVQVAADGGYRFTPSADWWGTDAFTWRATTALGATLTGKVTITIAAPPVRLNEILTHVDPPDSCGVELFNPLDVEVDISGWVINKAHSMEIDPTWNYVIPTGTILQPGEYRTYVQPAADGKDIPLGVLPFIIYGEGGWMFLHSRHDGRPSGLHSGAKVPPCPKPFDFGWHGTSDGREVFPVEQGRSFGGANAGPLIAPVVIGEIAITPSSATGDAAFIELTNRSGASVQAYGTPKGVPRTAWRLTADEVAIFTFPLGFVFASGESVLLVAPGTDIAAFRACHHLPSRQRVLAMTGAMAPEPRLALQWPTELTKTLVWFGTELVTVHNHAPWPLCTAGMTLRRTRLDAYPDDPASWSAGTPTPGMPEGAQAPLALADDYGTAAEQRLLVDAAHGVLANDRDPCPNGDTLTAALVTGPSLGVLEFQNHGGFSYVPKPGLSGAVDRFTYRAVDISGLTSAETTVTVRIGSDTTTPIARPDRYESASLPIVTVDAGSGVLANDQALRDGAVLQAELVDGPANGMVTLGGDGGFIWTPLPGFTGSDRFTYRVGDGQQWSAAVPVTLVMDAPFLPWVKGLDYTYTPGDFATTTEVLAAPPLIRGTVPAVRIPTVDQKDHFGLVYTGAIDLALAGTYQFHLVSDDGARLWIGGALVIDHDGPLYARGERTAPLVVAPGSEGRRVLRIAYYEKTGSNGLTLGWTRPDGVRESPLPTNGPLYRLDRNAFCAVDDAYAASVGHTLTVSGRYAVLANDRIPAGRGRSWEPTTLPDAGILTGPNTDGGFTYQPPAGFAGRVLFTYRIVSDGARSAPATATITVGPADPTVPVPGADAYVLRQDSPLTMPSTTGVLANDQVFNGGHLTASVESGPRNGTLALQEDGGFTYAPAAGFIGRDRFTYRASDRAGSATGTVLITVLPRGRLDRMAIGPRQVLPGPRANLSGITWHPERRHWYGITNGSTTVPAVVYEWDEAFTRVLRRMTVVGDYDCEDIAWMEGDAFAIVGESGNLVAIATIDAATSTVSVAAGACQRYLLQKPSAANLGWEGVAYDPTGAGGLGTFYAVQEKSPSRLVAFDRLADRSTMKDFVIYKDFAITDIHDVRGAWTPTGVATDLSAVTVDRSTGTLLVLSQESNRLLELTRAGVLIGSRDVPKAVAGGADQCEGVCVGPTGEVVIVSEPNLMLRMMPAPAAAQ